MGRGSKVCVDKSSRKRRTPSMEIESDEEYKVDEDEEGDDSDEDCSLDGDESEDFLADFEEEDEEVKTKAKRVPRSKKARKNLPARKANRLKVPRKKRRASYTQEEAEDEEEDYEEDEDEDDDEFLPDDSDSVDDEDEKPTMEKYEKATRQPLQKMDSIKVQRNSSKSKAFRRLTRQKLRNSRPGMRKTSSANSMPVADKNVVLKRKRRLRRIDSDSDFASPASSDYEYTISEEEREQMREANVLCADVKSNLRSSIGKRWEQEQKMVCQKRKCPARKGKEKVDDMRDNEVVKQVCGVCLSEEGKKRVQGSLNCCTHYFCFPCIMEWSKVESRCPLCKQRFTTISKAARSNTGFDLRTVVIQIPERDQVYQPSEEELQAYLDPYESVICTECHQGGDDALMLLCDICDSPAHTFCVGLGHEVPEGNWYCEGCRPGVFGSLVNSQGLAPMPDRRPNRNFRGLSLGIDLNEMYVPETTLTQETGVQPPRHTVGEFLSVSPASTVRDRRILHQHIHRLNRMSHFSSGRSNETPTSSTGLRLFGAQLDQGRERDLLTTEQRLTRLDDNDTMPSIRDRDGDPPSGMRWSQFRGQGQSSTSVPIDGSLQGESGAGFNPIWGFGQLHPFISRSSIAPDASPSPYVCREARGPSRTSQGSLNTPY